MLKNSIRRAGVIFLTAATLSGCSLPNSAENAKESVADILGIKKETEIATETESTTGEYSMVGFSSTIMDLTGENEFGAFYLDGYKYTFPVSIQDIRDMEYEISEENLSSGVAANKYTNSVIALRERDGAMVSVSAINYYDDTISFKDCQLYKITGEIPLSASEQTTVDFHVGNGAQLGVTTLQDFDQIFTNPTDTYDGETYCKREFANEQGKITYTFSGDILFKLEVECFGQ